jgi:hypothetical protein
MPDARWSDPRAYDDRDRGDDRPASTASDTETITTRATL